MTGGRVKKNTKKGGAHSKAVATLKKAATRVPTPRQIERQVKLVLTELMNGSESDTVRVAAAKALIDKLAKKPDDETKGDPNDQEEHNAALLEARELLAQLAAAQSVRFRRARKVAVRRT